MWGATFCSCQRTKSAKFSKHEGSLHLHVGAVRPCKAFQLVDGQELAVAFLHRDLLLRRQPVEGVPGNEALADGPVERRGKDLLVAVGGILPDGSLRSPEGAVPCGTEIGDEAAEEILGDVGKADVLLTALPEVCHKVHEGLPAALDGGPGKARFPGIPSHPVGKRDVGLPYLLPFPDAGLLKLEDALGLYHLGPGHRLGVPRPVGWGEFGNEVEPKELILPHAMAVDVEVEAGIASLQPLLPDAYGFLGLDGFPWSCHGNVGIVVLLVGSVVTLRRRDGAPFRKCGAKVAKKNPIG